jgi:hypothetical protein
MQTTKPARRAGRPPKIAGGAVRWWLYVSPTARALAEERAAAEGTTLPDVVRAFLDRYVEGGAL